MTIRGWKDVARYIEGWTGVPQSADAVRKLADRDPELRAIVQVVNGKPTAQQRDLHGYVQRVQVTRTKVTRVQQALWLVSKMSASEFGQFCDGVRKQRGIGKWIQRVFSWR